MTSRRKLCLTRARTIENRQRTKLFSRTELLTATEVHRAAEWLRIARRQSSRKLLFWRTEFDAFWTTLRRRTTTTSSPTGRTARRDFYEHRKSSSLPIRAAGSSKSQKSLQEQMWLLVLASLLLQLSEGQCGIHQTCVECNVFLSTTGNACKWCAGGGLNVGCVDKGATCPGATSAQTVCPPPLCETAATCGECLGRASPSGGACGWCTTSTKLNIGCRSSSASCVGSTSNKFWLDCSFPSEPVVVPVTFVWPTPFFSLSMGLGLVIGLFVYVRNRNADMSRIVKACYGLFFLSFFLYGAALFSFLLSLHVVSKTSRKCCSCYCFWIWFFGCMEVTSVWVGMLTAAVIDG